MINTDTINTSKVLKNITKCRLNMKNALFFAFITALLLSCSPKIIYVPQYQYIHQRDSVYLKDTVVKVELQKGKISDFVDVKDTLVLQNETTRATAFIDTTKAILRGSLENTKPYVEKPVQFKEKIVYRDSVVIQEKPVEVEVEKIVKVVPLWAKILSAFGIAALTLIVAKIVLWLKNKGII